jgi:hypothetical protein
VSKYVECHDPLQFVLNDKATGVFALRNKTNAIERTGCPHFYLLRVKNSKALFLHVSITLKAPRIGASNEVNHEFKGISVQFLQGTGNLFCRAEWDVTMSRGKLNHPQPHWHFGCEIEGEELNQFVVNDNAAMDVGFIKEIEDNGLVSPAIDFRELHYAMASKWVIKDSAEEIFSQQHLYTWLENCIANVIDQYNYQVNKKSFESSKEWS